MKNILLTIVLGFSVMLGGCASVGQPPGTGTNPDINAIIAQVQANAKIACGFVPTATTILNIIGAAVPGVGVATSIAAAICAAVAPPPPMAGRKAFGTRTVRGYSVTPGMVNGVRVEGNSVR